MHINIQLIWLYCANSEWKTKIKKRFVLICLCRGMNSHWLNFPILMPLKVFQSHAWNCLIYDGNNATYANQCLSQMCIDIFIGQTFNGNAFSFDIKIYIDMNISNRFIWLYLAWPKVNRNSKLHLKLWLVSAVHFFSLLQIKHIRWEARINAAWIGYRISSNGHWRSKLWTN